MKCLPIIKGFLIFLCISCFLSACNHKREDKLLREQVSSIEKSPVQPIPALVFPKTEQTDANISSKDRDPFSAGNIPTLLDEKKPENVDELEQYTLSQLAMVGTLMKEGEYWGLIQLPSGIVRRINSGQYIGSEHARVVSITADKIFLEEKFSMGSGWNIRKAELSLLKEGK